MYYELSDRFEVSHGIDKTWKFFSQAENLPKITPPWLNFTLVNCPPIQQDTVLDYTIRWMGIPIHWRTRIIDWTPPRQFIDLQIRGPYTLWHHQHTFDRCDSGTICTDRVIYKLPFPLLRGMVHPLIVKKQLLDIFRYRRRVIAENLGWTRAIQDDVMIQPLR